MKKQQRQAIAKGKKAEQTRVETSTIEAPVAVAGKLPKMPKLPSTGRARGPRKPKPFVSCACGCETQTRSKWAPGHDARARAWAIRIERDIIKLKDVPANEQAGAKLMLAERKKLVDSGAIKPQMQVVQGGKTDAKTDDKPVAVNE